jgi:hypothetical protein
MKFPPHRESGSTRVYFVNANGVRYGAKGGEMNDICARVLEGNRDKARYKNGMCYGYQQSRT